ncbi:DUF1648 domain-containing protein [Streptomyces ureilyticus]|uniref:DUF1648 domain-containing protein n=1 Tax=Streptomyces ureilyticus TaxID=1775131 RepID=A0ABX0E1X0_9ACTN|nr:DUF1648 domain-containing protein [Streptomyces ureilyticus]NGO48201.1 DUF1648 domain-containing protein [Streptomyces ureilyticus]
MTATNMSNRYFTRRAAPAVAPFLAGAIATTIAFLLLKDSFPSKVATHFTLDGTADGFSSPATAFGQYMLLFTAEAAGSVAAVFSAKAASRVRPLVVFSCALSAATTYLLVAAMQANTARDSETAQLPLYQLAMAVAVGAVTGAVGWLLSRRRA